jgi:hypothetical protein
MTASRIGLIAIDASIISTAAHRVILGFAIDVNPAYLMLDTALVRAHQQAETGKGGPKIRLWGVPEED